MDHIAIITEAKAAAYEAGKAYLDKHWGGQDAGACGFAWVNIYPQHKGNTKEGKEERRILRAMGFELDWTGMRFLDQKGVVVALYAKGKAKNDQSGFVVN